MKRLATSMLAVLCGLATFATDYTWKAVSNDFDGMFTDPAHWSGNAIGSDPFGGVVSGGVAGIML